MAKARKTSKNVNLDFAFFTYLHNFYKANRGIIRNHYRSLTKRFLDYNDPENNSKAFLRQPQFEALEIYVFLKEYLDNAAVHEIFKEWADNTGKFEGRTIAERSGQIQLDILKEASKEKYEAVFERMRSYARTYSNYIFALTMGTGKTILMATCIFYEFILANKWPKDKKYCHNALVFAPDKTVLQSLREIQTFDMTKVVPPEYVNFLVSHLQFHFLDEAGATLTVLDKSRFNVIISNTQKIILKRQHKEKTPIEKLMGSGKPDYQADSVYAQNADLYGFDQPDDEDSLTSNQRFEKLRRIEQLGIYIDEAHHAFGNQLANDMGIKQTATSLRLTVDELAASLERAGTHVVACYNYTGTPYVGKEVLPEVVYAYGLREAIDKGFLKKVRINSYTNSRSNEFVEIAIADFLKHNSNQRYEGMLPKMAFFAATIEELQKELRPAVEQALAKHNIPSSSILVNVGDEKLTTNDDIREFNRLDTPESDKQFILLVNKGREGWNCRSLFSVALFRQPKSKIFVLQATMRCLRAIGEGQQTGQVYLSEDNKVILENELQQNFRISIQEIGDISKDKETVKVHPVPPPVKIKLRRVRRQFEIKEKNLVSGINLKLDNIPEDLLKGYKIIHTEQEGISLKDASRSKVKTADLTVVRQKRKFSELTLVAEISRYLNKSCIFIENVLATTQEGTEKILKSVNEYNELLYDWVIPHLFKEFYEIDQEESTEEYEVELVKISSEGYTFNANKDLIVKREEVGSYATKSFHLDTYCFDSSPERTLFWNLLREGRVKTIYFTGMLTHGQSDFYIEYIDPDSHSIRKYYPDFLFQKEDDSYVIVEVKGDNKIEDPVVQAKKQFAEQMATASQMTYKIIAGSEAGSGHYISLFS
ncbi:MULTISPECIES: TnsA endonuclease N-terminal domain-containing protein [Nostoc]|uniref:DEAD/DEAH box helicase family protein n=1 Tax=Nostoc paludosum FACHB-159 TaxID=2692908 RepID=A0ABR8KJD9_9NOSO|nr:MULTISPECIES: TnsA endonuclease N-terminal domain-containing protein [Nostoc]MBD2682655.1 DEAD/DEAH box helicase family protein [Nostoc sp. FACHB-857]MBD2738989.1 DEAD/DEAH box helicase family protein [Nostoc paludosum FACHB-159]